VLKRTYFMPVIDGVFCVDARVIYRHERRFNRYAWVGWDCGQL